MKQKLEKFIDKIFPYIMGSFFVCLAISLSITITACVLCLPALFVNVLLEIKGIWSAPIWLYVLEALVGAGFWVGLYHIKNRNDSDEEIK